MKTKESKPKYKLKDKVWFLQSYRGEIMYGYIVSVAIVPDREIKVHKVDLDGKVVHFTNIDYGYIEYSFGSNFSKREEYLYNTKTELLNFLTNNNETN